MSSKRKGLAAQESGSSSDSDISDSELLNIAKRRKRSPSQEKKRRSSSGSSNSDGEVKKAKTTRDEKKKKKVSSDVEDGEVSESDSEIGEFDDGLDDNLMGDEEDRKRLQLMSEKEREEELFKRAEKRETLKKRYEIEKKLKMQKKKSQEDILQEKSLNKTLDTKERSRARKEAVESKRDKKTVAMDELKAKRKVIQEQQQKKEDESKKDEKDSKKKWKPNEIYSSDSSDEDVERERSRSRSRGRRHSSSSSNSSSSVSSRSRSPSLERRVVTRTATREDLETVRLSRNQLEKWCHMPFFDKVANGCFVRIGIGQNHEKKPQYRIAEVMEVVEGNRIYQLGKSSTDKSLKLRHAHQERNFRMEFVSNDTFLEEEFQSWRHEIMMGGMSMPTLQEIEEKRREIGAAMVRQLSDKEINHMIKEKEKYVKNPKNYAMFKTRLAKDRDIAAAEGRTEEAEKLTRRLLDLEERAEKLDRQRSEKISSIALINDRNRKRNIEKAEENIKQEIEKKRLEGEVSDPFTRRKTKPMLATAVIKKKDDLPVVKPNSITQAGANASTEQAADKSGTAPDEKKENKPVEDLFSAHNFEIKIDLNDHAPNSAIKMNLTPIGTARKDVGPKKSLNLADYKKKRGLI